MRYRQGFPKVFGLDGSRTLASVLRVEYTMAPLTKWMQCGLGNGLFKGLPKVLEPIVYRVPLLQIHEGHFQVSVQLSIGSCRIAQALEMFTQASCVSDLSTPITWKTRFGEQHRMFPLNAFVVRRCERGYVPA